MEIEATPPLTDRELGAVLMGLAKLAIDLSTKPSIGASVWQLAAAREAVASEPSRPRYARSPRRTRGAPRA